MYSPKIREDLIPLIYLQSKLVAKTMTKYLDDLIRPLIMNNENIRKDENENSEEKRIDNEKRREIRKGNNKSKDFNDYINIDIKEIRYCCKSCRMQVNETDGEKGYCEICECEVFVEKI